MTDADTPIAQLNPDRLLAKQGFSRKLRVGLLLDSLTLRAWQYEMLRQIVGSDYADIALLVLKGNTREQRGPLRSRLWSYYSSILYRIYRKLERCRPVGKSDGFVLKDGRDLLRDIPAMTVMPRTGRYSDWLSEEDVDKIKSHNLDVLIRLGFRILRGGVLKAAAYGVWSYHHGDSQTARGGPPGFWEVFENSPVIGSTLQILDDTLDGGRILFRSVASTDTLSVRRTCNNYYWKTLAFIPRKLKELHDWGEEEFFRQADELDGHPRFYSHRVHKTPRNGELLKLMTRFAGRYVNRKLHDALFDRQWILMYSLRDEMPQALETYHRIVPPKDRFWADPQVVHKDATYYVFLEEYLFATQKGHISLMTIDERGNQGQVVPILQRPYHLSYPFIFQWQGRYFMVPETRATGTISLYECVEFPYKWEFRHHLMENVSAMDTTLYFDGDRWWLFSAMISLAGASTSDELFVFYSDNPLSRRWIPHRRNPVISDARSSRPAGTLFRHKGRLYRPSQDCSRDYGFGVNINHVVTLNENRYHEETVQGIFPHWDKRLTGVHTFQHEHRLTIIDARLVRSKLARICGEPQCNR